MNAWRRIRAWIPLASRARDGVGVVFGVFFYLFLLVIAARPDVWRQLGAAEQWLLVVAAVVLLLAACEPLSERSAALRRRLAAKPVAIVSMVVLMALVCTSLLAPFVAGADPTALTRPSLTRYEAPAPAHPMGTDRFGRDVWARVAWGGRASFGVCALSILLAALLGTGVGALAGMSPRRVDDVLMRIVDGMLSFPRLLLLLAAVAFLPPGPVMLALVIAGTGWMGIARIVRGEVRRMRGREFVDAAVAAGAGRGRILVNHILPNAAGAIVVAATLAAGTVILLESSLSFLGLGVQPPAPSWGAMVFEGRDALATAWWVSAFPALAITLAVVSLNLIGDGVSDALNTRA